MSSLSRCDSLGPPSSDRKLKKALYQEYTDDSFKTLKPRPAEWQHLGMLGPLIRVQVGDAIRVVFRNNANFPATIHPHGVFYRKDSEGADYSNHTPAQQSGGFSSYWRHLHLYVAGARARRSFESRRQFHSMDAPLACQRGTGMWQVDLWVLSSLRDAAWPGPMVRRSMWTVNSSSASWR
jgi:hypothetical protein